MRLHLQDLVNRLSQFSERLDNTTLLIDKPWVLIDAESNYHKYIFKRNGELIMSRNGQSHIGRWEYVTAGRSLLIHRKDDRLLLNQSFFDSAVMALKIDGTSNELFILANETIIPDLDVAKYLHSTVYRKYNVVAGILENGKTLEIHLSSATGQIENGLKATIDGEKPNDGKYKSLSSGRYYVIRNGIIFRITSIVPYKTVDGINIEIEQDYMITISIGYKVFIDNQPAKTGKYKLSAFKHLVVVNGIVTNITWF